MSTTQPPMLLIKGGVKTYSVDLRELSEFLDACDSELMINNPRDIENTIVEICDQVIDGTDNDASAMMLKRHLKFLGALDMMFRGLLHETQPVSC